MTETRASETASPSQEPPREEVSEEGHPKEAAERRRRSRVVLIVPLVLMVALLGLMFVGLQSGDPSRLPSVLIGKPVPEFKLAGIANLQNGSGSSVPGFSSADLKQGKVSLVNVWGSWCAPCLAEHPQLLALAKEGVPLYGINYKGDTPEGAKRYLARHGNPFLAVGADETGMVAIDFGVYGVPETFVIDGSGRIILRYPGALTPEVIADTIKPAMARAQKAEKEG